MRTSSYSGSKVRQNFNKFFDKAHITRIGKSSGLFNLKPKKKLQLLVLLLVYRKLL